MLVCGVRRWVGGWVGDVGAAKGWRFLLANIVVAVAGAVSGPMLPSGPGVNRKVPLAGSRFSPLQESV